MKILKICFFSLQIFFLSSFCFASESVEDLLKAYLKNSLTLLKLSSQLENQILENQSVKIENGFNIQISSGNVQVEFEDSPKISFSPSVSFGLPQADNLTLTVSSDFDIDGKNSLVSNTSFSLSADVYSNSMATRKITLEKAERNLLEIQRKLQNGFLSVETEFYTNLKSLYELATNVELAQNDLYEDELDFEKIKAQGYSSGSPTYRLAQMKVIADQYKVEQYKHSLLSEVKIFAVKCDIEFLSDDVWTFLPFEIPQVEAVYIESFKKEDFADIENAVWTHQINQKSRDADKSFSIKASAGYTFDNEISSNNYMNTVDGGTSFTWNDSGLTANFGVSVPISEPNPIYKFGLSVVPNQFRLAKISEQQKELESKQEKISIQSAENDYETTLISQKSALDDIKFNKEKNKETYELYNQLEKDTILYYERGLISESEYKSVQTNKENYRIQCLINDIELIIYNNKTKLFFNRDDELKVKFELSGKNLAL